MRWIAIVLGVMILFTIFERLLEREERLEAVLVHVVIILASVALLVY